MHILIRVTIITSRLCFKFRPDIQLCILGPEPISIPTFMRRRRSVPATNVTVFKTVEVNFSVAFVTTGCRTWDDDLQAWVSQGCEVKHNGNHIKNQFSIIKL